MGCVLDHLLSPRQLVLSRASPDYVRSYLSRNLVVSFLCPPTMASQKDHQHRVGHLDRAENRHDDSQDGC
jgi:hypothetical protein